MPAHEVPWLAEENDNIHILENVLIKLCQIAKGVFMKGVQIFLHSVRQVVANMQPALQVSAVPYVLQALLAFAILGPQVLTGQRTTFEVGEMTGGQLWQMLAFVPIIVVPMIWVAVAWHRFVLKGEMPHGLVPAFNAGRIWGYFLRSLAIICVMLPLLIALGLVGGLVSSSFLTPDGSNLAAAASMFLIFVFPITAVSYRFSTALPATALEKAGEFWAGWDATKGEFATISVMTLISTAAFFLVSEAGIRLFGGSAPLAFIWEFVWGWFSMMIGLSILTTLYGHYIEGRPLV